MQGFHEYEAEEVAARVGVCVCVCACLKATKLSPQCDGWSGHLVDG